MLETTAMIQTAPVDPPILEFREVKKHFKASGRQSGLRGKQVVRAVDGVSLQIDRGETLGIVGESGCGKTTLAKLALLLEAPTGGQILFRGQDIAGLDREGTKQFRSSVQAVFQDPWSSLNPRMRVQDIVLEPVLVNRPRSRAEMSELAAELMAMVGLPVSFLRRFPHELSGGQRQRVAIARALSLRPDLIVLDEPVS
ncbi:MAG: ATP-binding cassette domain-containing protein, partial [Chloroflexota bacterium]